MNIISKLKEDPSTVKHEPQRRKISDGRFSLNIICRRFPHVAQTIFKKLDDRSLKRSKEVSKEISEVLKNERFYWIRIIKTYVQVFQGNQESWNEVITKIPLSFVKPLALALIQFCKHHSLKPSKKQSKKGTLLTHPFGCSNCNEAFEEPSALKCHYYMKNCFFSPEVLEDPIFIVAENDNFQLFQYVFGITINKNPTGSFGIVGHNFGISPKNFKYYNGKVSSKLTLLHLMAINGNSEICKLILDNIDDCNPKSKCGVTPFLIAATNGHFEV